MSRILRRPMFRGGSANEGIMSVPRKGYAEDGFVNEDDVAADENLLDSGTITTKPAGLTISDSGVDLNKYNAAVKDVVQSKGITADKLKNLSTSDIMMAEYLGNRPDPLGKFLIQFGLNYMSARPKGGKFGALATAAESAKKPTEQLYADIDTDRLLKLKLMSALGKSEGTVADVKRAKAAAETRNAPNSPYKGLSYDEAYQRAYQDILRGSLEKKATTLEERIAVREKSYETDLPGIRRVKAKLFEAGIPKLGKEEKNIDYNNMFIGDSEKSILVQKPNSTDAQIKTPPQNIDKIYKVGDIYIDVKSRNAYKYAGSNTFRFVQSLE